MTSSPQGIDKSLPLGNDWIVENIQRGLVVVDSRGVVQLFNRWMADRSGLTRSEVLGRTLVDVFPELAKGRVLQAVANALENGFPAALSNRLNPAPFPLYSNKANQAANERIQQSTLVQSSNGQGKEPRQVLLEISDVSAAVQREKTLIHQASLLATLSSTDALTGLANRRRLDAVLLDEFRRSVRLKQPLAIVLIDLDFFKVFNDTYGHQRGDHCLKQISLIMQSVLKRSSDLVARYGGEEFMIVLPQTDAQGAKSVANTLRTVLAEQALAHVGNPNGGVVTISQGIAVLMPNEVMTLNGLIERADLSLYAAKRSGRNRIAVLGAERDIDPEVLAPVPFANELLQSVATGR